MWLCIRNTQKSILNIEKIKPYLYNIYIGRGEDGFVLTQAFRLKNYVWECAVEARTWHGKNSKRSRLLEFLQKKKTTSKNPTLRSIHSQKETIIPMKYVCSVEIPKNHIIRNAGHRCPSITSLFEIREKWFQLWHIWNRIRHPSQIAQLEVSSHTHSITMGVICHLWLSYSV